MKRRSHGIYAFATPLAHYRNLSGKFRLLAEQGRAVEIADYIAESLPMNTSGGSFDHEEYMRWAPDVYRHVEINRWSPDYWMTREASFLKQKDFEDAERVYRNVPKSQYIPVHWTNGCVSEKEVKLFARMLMECTERKAVPLFYFAVRRENGNYILYARKDWMDSFQTGQDLLNFYRMAKNFKKVFGFT